MTNHDMDRATEQRLWELGNTGVIVEDDVLKIVDRIRKMDPNLDVQFLDPDIHASLTDAPYQIIERCRDGIPRVVFTTWTLDERVIERLRLADTLRNDVLANVDAANLTARIASDRRWEEIRLEEADLVKHILQSPKGSYSWIDRDGESHTVQDDPGRR